MLDFFPSAFHLRTSLTKGYIEHCNHTPAKRQKKRNVKLPLSLQYRMASVDGLCYCLITKSYYWENRRIFQLCGMLHLVFIG